MRETLISIIERHVREHPGISGYALVRDFGPSASSALYRLYKAGVVRTWYDASASPFRGGDYRYMHVMTNRGALPNGDRYLSVYERRWSDGS